MRNIEIAKRLGISATAVSLALNHHPGVSDKTRKQVLYLKTLGEEDTVSRLPCINLVIHKKHGEIINDKPFFINLISTIQQEAYLHSFRMNIIHYSQNLDMEMYLRSLKQAKASGTLLLATEMLKEDLEPYRTLDTPLLFLDSHFELEDYDSVTINNREAIFKTVAYLYKLGHRRIGYLKSSIPINNFSQRFDGYTSALKYFHLDDKASPVFSLHCSTEQAHQDMKRILRRLPEDFILPTAFICDLDYIALGAMKAMLELGYQIPGDVSLTGFDDIAASRVVTPSLTTIRINQEDIGRTAVQCLVNRIRHPEEAAVNLQISSSLIERESSGSPARHF